MSRQTGIPPTSVLELLKSSTVTLAVFVAGIVLTVAACSKDVSPESNQVVFGGTETTATILVGSGMARQ
ncbi:hypothetical protein [Williamsia sp.]|uniref:hypothetical protein n=1 Tax=Williamsia sp. TaxID=1872085 RepID=UPI002F93184E